MSESPIKKQALLIGINQYAILPELKYARQDAEAVEESLKQNYIFSDDEVMLLTDAKPGLFKPLNKRIIQTHLENLANQELDLFIFGFWGHGLFRNGERYLCPLDVMGDAVEEQGFSFKELQRLLANVRAKNTCIILDCCQTIHDRGESETLTFADKAVMENAARDIVLKRKEQMPDFQSNVVILNSCKEGQSAYEWDKRQHGIFTAHLLDAFSRRYESVSQIVGYISKNVNKTALELGKIQTPYSKLEGDIILPVRTGSTPLVVGDVFISYRHSQAKLIAPIEEELKRRGISCFTDRVGVNYGMEYAEAIARAIKACKVLLVVWTQDANDSPDMVREVKMALDLKKKVIPYKIGTFNAVEHNALYYQLAPISRYETLAQTPQSVMEIVNRIKQTLTGKTPETAPSKPVSSQQYTAVHSQTSTVIQTHPHKKKTKSAIEATTNRFILNITLLVLICICFVSSFFAMLKDNENARKQKSDAVQTPVKEDNSVIEQPVADTEESESAIEEIDPDLMDDIPATPLKQPIILPKAGKTAGERAVVTVNGVEFAFRWCPAGTFTMGSPESEEGRFFDEKQHEVTLTKGFWIMETEVTNKQWNLFMVSNPSTLKQDESPVQRVTWDSCQEFCSHCSKVGFPVQLPTEAQWEYACRAGTVDAYAVKPDEAPNNESNILTINPAGSLYQNPWGIYEMHGNMPEWCQDKYGEYPDESVTDPTGPSSGMTRVIRGGVGSNLDNYTRSASRHHDNQYRISFIGFRCVLPVEDNDSSNNTADATDKSDEKAGSDVQSLSSKSVLQTGSQAGERAVVTVNGVEFAFRWCPAGTFSMGNLNDEYINPHHEVTLTKGFWMMETEVTQKQWKAVMGENPGSFKSEDCPVNKVSWNDCQEFCKKCSERGLPVELPTEAQWEYACRAGTTRDFAGNVDEMAWYGGKPADGAHPVGTKKPNAWGLYDMHGNVMEWCQDWHAEYSKESASDPTGPSSGEDRVIRGGFFTLTAEYCSSHFRLPPLKPDDRFLGNGFRCVVNEQ